MNIGLEYIMCELMQQINSAAVEAHRIRLQNPGLKVEMDASIVVWKLMGLLPVSGNITTKGPPSMRFDFYIGRSELLAQRSYLPAARTRAKSIHLLTNPSGKERKDTKVISWSGPISKLPVTEASVFFPSNGRIARTTQPSFLHIDWEPAAYPLQDRTRTQLHFSIQSEFRVSADKIQTEPFAEIVLSDQQYADVLEILMRII